MACPTAVNQALVGSDAVVKVEMLLDRDQFVITFKPSLATVADLIAIVKEAGFDSRVVSPPTNIEAPKEKNPQPELPDFFVEALAQSKRERKPIVLDFTADWCLPCQRMEKETFPDSAVAALLERCIVLKVDPDEHPALAQHFSVVGLPDIRLITPDGAEAAQLLDFQPPEKLRMGVSQVLADEPDAD